MADLASSSEYSVLRASGYRPDQAVIAMLRLGLPLALLTVVLSELVLPWSEVGANKARAFSSVSGGQSLRSGMWLRDNTGGIPNAPAERFVNIRESLPNKRFREVVIYEFDDNQRLVAYLRADSGDFFSEGGADDQTLTRWRLSNVKKLEIDGAGAAKSIELGEVSFLSAVSPATLDALLVRPEQMSAYQLGHYISYLSGAKQSVARYELAMWKKITYPLAIWAMLILALPAAYIQVRSGYLGLKIFIGIAAGLSFYLFNSLFTHLTLINNWSAPAVACTPSLIALSVALIVLQIAQRRAL